LFEVEMLVNAGQYQNFVLKVKGATADELLANVASMTDDQRQRLGYHFAELESHFKQTRKDALDGAHTVAMETVKALGATVESETAVPDAPVQVWDEKREPTDKPWDKNTQEDDLDDF
jgi:hypothetical protein